MYWNMQSQCLAGLDMKAWLKAMQTSYRSEDFRHGDHEDGVDMAKR